MYNPESEIRTPQQNVDSEDKLKTFKPYEKPTLILISCDATSGKTNVEPIEAGDYNTSGPS